MMCSYDPSPKNNFINFFLDKKFISCCLLQCPLLVNPHFPKYRYVIPSSCTHRADVSIVTVHSPFPGPSLLRTQQ